MTRHIQIALLPNERLNFATKAEATMVAISKLLYSAILAATDLNGSVSQLKLSMLEIEASLVNYRCMNNAVPGGRFVITQANAVGAMNGAPFTTGRSGYPHEFQNFGGITWATYQCNHAKLQEFPVLINGAIYNADSRPKDNPGPARVIYTTQGQPSGYKLFCGVVAHVGENGNPNRGYLSKCV